MSGFEYSSGGRRVSADQFWQGIRDKAIDAAMATLQERAHGAAASIVDPETGRHAEVFVRRVGEQLVLSTKGSPQFARELERRLGVDKGSIEAVSTPATTGAPKVYLAHASEDKDTLARPLAQVLMAAGIETWFDEWEIGTGDSLKRRMEQGLEDCTHFIVLLTAKSIGKAWVETEIDAGFMMGVQGRARFMGLRHGVEVNELSVFLQTVRCPAFDLANPVGIAGLVAEIYSVTQKPARGQQPAYVRTTSASTSSWAPAAARVAEYLVTHSVNGGAMDPMTQMSTIAAETTLGEEDIRLGVLDLMDAGLVGRSGEVGSGVIWPLRGLFVEFDRYALGFDTKADALAVANRVLSENFEGIRLDDEFLGWFPGWTVRRLNGALHYLEDAKLIDAQHSLGQRPWAMLEFYVTDRTRRFVRDHG
jgi:hypothetical protein